MKVSRTPLALLCACVALEVAVVAAEYMYRPAHGPPHLVHGHGPHGPHGPHKHHPYASGKAPGGGPGKHPPPRLPPPHYHGRPMHRPRKPPPPLSAASPWKTTAYKTTAFKTTKEPFLLHGADADFASQAAALSATKLAGTQLTSITGGSLASSHVSPVARPSLHALPALHTYTNVVSDDRGPIHTIPAPQLSPADRPSHMVESQIYGGEHHALQLQQSLQRQAIQSALSQLSAAQAARPTGPTTIAPVLHHTQGYQVSEPSTASQAHEGANLFAPDPDPSRPAAKVRPTTDPYSLPSEGRGPHFSIDPQFGAVSSQPGYMSASASLSPQDLFHLLNGFPLQGLQGLQPLQQDVRGVHSVHGVHGVHGVQPHIQIMPHGLTGDTLTAEHQHLLLQQQQLQQQQLQQQYQQQVQAQAHAAQSQRQLQLHPADFHHSPQYQSFDFDEQSYQKTLFQGQDQHDHEVSEDAPRPSVQRPDPVVQDASPSASTVSLFTVAPPQPTGSTPPRGRADQDEADQDDAETDEAADDEDYEDAAAPSKHSWGSSTTLAQPAVTPAPQASASLEDDGDSLQQQVVIREEAGSYASDPSLVTPFRRQPNSVQVAEAKVAEGKPLPYGARIRPKRVAEE